MAPSDQVLIFVDFYAALQRAMASGWSIQNNGKCSRRRTHPEATVRCSAERWTAMRDHGHGHD
jgi:hypothetical protein